MSWCRIMLASLLFFSLVVHKTSGGPAHTLALTLASRAAKIPRTIRAPFRNSEMMTARGFGKRSENVRMIDVPTSIDSTDNNPLISELSSEVVSGGRRYPVQLILDELFSNPNLLKQLILRAFDANNDGNISQLELEKNQQI